MWKTSDKFEDTSKKDNLIVKAETEHHAELSAARDKVSLLSCLFVCLFVILVLHFGVLCFARGAHVICQSAELYADICPINTFVLNTCKNVFLLFASK
jgi:hypothetical protein